MQLADAWGSSDWVRDLVARLEDRPIANREVLERALQRIHRATDALRAAWSPVSVGREAEGLVEAAIDQVQIATALLDVAMRQVVADGELRRRDEAYRAVLDRAKGVGSRD
jgi:hypothetical protein